MELRWENVSTDRQTHTHTHTCAHTHTHTHLAKYSKLLPWLFLLQLESWGPHFSMMTRTDSWHTWSRGEIRPSLVGLTSAAWFASLVDLAWVSAKKQAEAELRRDLISWRSHEGRPVMLPGRECKHGRACYRHRQLMLLVVSPQDFPQVGAIKKKAGHEFLVLSTTLYRLSRAWAVVGCSEADTSILGLTQISCQVMQWMDTLWNNGWADNRKSKPISMKTTILQFLVSHSKAIQLLSSSSTSSSDWTFAGRLFGWGGRFACLLSLTRTLDCDLCFIFRFRKSKPRIFPVYWSL